MTLTFEIQHPKARAMKEIIDKLDLIKIKTFCSVKKNEKTSQTRRKYLQRKKVSDKRPLFKGWVAGVFPPGETHGGCAGN